MSISQSFNAGSTAIVTVTFEDEDGNTVKPYSATWSLYAHNTIINNRKDINITGFYIENNRHKADIVLQGDDLPGGGVYLVVKGNYNSNAGTGLPLRAWTEIPVNSMPFY